MPDEEPKIIIDEGWKARVQREREEARIEVQAGEKTSAGPGPSPAADEGDVTLFEQLLSGLVAQIMRALGLMAPEGQSQIKLDLSLAKHLIDTMTMLKDKTKGNLNPREERSLVESIAELQRAYVARSKQAQEAALKNAGIEPNKPAPS